MKEKNESLASPAEGKALRMLLIEDSDTDDFILRRALSKYAKNIRGFRARNFSEGEEALKKGDLDFVMLDLGLPDTAGPVETYERIKKWTDKFPIIVMTSLEDHVLAKLMVQEGVADFLHKDMIIKNPERILEAIDFSVTRHALRHKTEAEKEKILAEMKQKDTVLNCFMGGYSIF